MAQLELKPSRRAFLGTLAGLSLPRCARTPLRRPIEGGIVGGAHRRGHRVRDGYRPTAVSAEPVGVAILGAGVTGLCAGWALERAGIDDWVVLELEDAPGGTARSGIGPVSAFPWGAHYVPAPPPENRPLVALLEELGAITGRDAAGRPEYAEDVLVREPEERVFYRGEWFEGLYPLVGASPEDRRQLEAFESEVARWVAWRDRSGRRAFAVPRARGSDDPELRALDGSSFGAWLAGRGWDSPRLRWLAEYACRDDFGTSLDQTSAWAGIHYFAAREDERGLGTGDFLAWPEGNGRIVDHLAELAGARLRLGALVTGVDPGPASVHVVYQDSASGEPRALEARHVIFALPRFLARPLIAPYREAPPPHLAETVYGSWMVANLTLSARPAGRGFELAWDNVLYDSASLGYVVATHQSGRDHGPTVLTYYLPLVDADVRAARTLLLETTWEAWVESILDDLGRAHPDIGEVVERVDVYLWGHAMVLPRPGFMWSSALRESSRPLERVHFAHTDLSGMALCEEAQYWGVTAAEAVMRERGHGFESWLS